MCVLPFKPVMYIIFLLLDIPYTCKKYAKLDFFEVKTEVVAQNSFLKLTISFFHRNTHTHTMSTTFFS